LNDRSLGNLDDGIPDPPARPVSGDRHPVVVLGLVPAANGCDLVMPSCHLDGKYLGTVVQRQNSAQKKKTTM